jgi:hypothetical protein
VIKHRRCDPLRISGRVRTSAYNINTYEVYNPANFTGYQYCPAYPDAPDWSHLKAKALANMNPFKAQTDIPLFLFELREFPRMLWDLGRVLQKQVRPSDIPGGYLAYQFGWKPLVSDLKSMLDFTAQVEKRQNYWRSIIRGEKVKRVIVNDSFDSEWTYTAATTMYGNVVGTVRRTTSEESWYSARLKFLESIPDPSDTKEVFRIVYGLRLNPSTIWNAVPWSWMIDYFTNIGDIIEARNGYNRWKFSELCLMSHQRIEETVGELSGGYAGNTVSHTGGTRYSEVKSRNVVGSDDNLPITFSPFLSKGQSAILGSLLTSRALKKVRM